VLEVMERLLAPDGCPWDREQTLTSLRHYLIEESFEVLDALDDNDVAAHCEELGDVLFQIVFQSALRAREGAFNIDDVCRSISDKMRRRHPHVFGEATVKDSAEVVTNWSAIKAAERQATGKVRRTLDGIPKSMPSLKRGQMIADKAAATGFDWPDIAGVRAKIDEELAELDAEVQAGLSAANHDRIEAEFGDVLFTLTRLAGKLGIDAEHSLRRANQRFIGRFNAMEDRIHADGQKLESLSLPQMNQHWESVKRSHKE
jgi:MazG family protein